MCAFWVYSCFHTVFDENEVKAICQDSIHHGGRTGDSYGTLAFDVELGHSIGHLMLHC